jgi:CheY-like chemotaxis protein
MNTRQLLYGIPELRISKRLPQMSDIQLKEYISKLHLFVEQFPEHEASLRNAMRVKDISSVSTHLSTFRELLVQIYADGLAEDCWKQMRKICDMKPERIEAYVNFLLSTTAALSIDLQMAFFIDGKDEVTPPADDSDKEHRIKAILAVDDDPFSLDVFKAAVKNLPCKVTAATSGEDTLDILNSQKPDLFVLDIEMPGMNGIELAKQITKQGSYAPYIFITGSATKEYVTKALMVGASDFILKPINPESAATRIGKFL